MAIFEVFRDKNEDMRARRGMGKILYTTTKEAQMNMS